MLCFVNFHSPLIAYFDQEMRPAVWASGHERSREGLFLVGFIEIEYLGLCDDEPFDFVVSCECVADHIKSSVRSPRCFVVMECPDAAKIDRIREAATTTWPTAEWGHEVKVITPSDAD